MATTPHSPGETPMDMSKEDAVSTLRLFLETRPVRGRYTLYEVERRAIARLLIEAEATRG